jgi:hypothetical protein
MKRLVLSALLTALAVVGWPYCGSSDSRHMARELAVRGADVKPGDLRVSQPLEQASRDSQSASPSAGKLEWRMIRDGFEAGELAVVAAGREVDRIFLARISPAKFRFEVRNEATPARSLDAWIRQLGAVLVINGSYYTPHNTPDTPVLSDGTLLGPNTYDARAGAFVASGAFAGIRDLSQQSWQGAFKGGRDAMVSYPLLIAENGASRVVASQRLAKRSFVGQDLDGNIILGTTAGGFFSLPQLAAFLRQAPLSLKLALNLDGGPVACQGISLDGFERRVCEIPALPIVLAVFPK